MIGVYDLGGARLNPYYTVEPDLARGGQPTLAKQTIPGCDIQLSDQEFQKKSLRLSLEKFVSDPSVENRENLENLIRHFYARSKGTSATVFLQGGAPGLGKRA
jgi:hypothetical protein